MRECPTAFDARSNGTGFRFRCASNSHLDEAHLPKSDSSRSTIPKLPGHMSHNFTDAIPGLFGFRLSRTSGIRNSREVLPKSEAALPNSEVEMYRNPQVQSRRSRCRDPRSAFAQPRGHAKAVSLSPRREVTKAEAQCL